MTRTKTILLVGFGGLAVVGILVAVALSGYVYSRKDEWLTQGRAIRAQGVEAGKAVTEPECVESALARYRNNQTGIGAIGSRVWLSGCLETSNPASDFCSEVPATSEITATVAWRLRTCGRYGFEADSTCANILTEVQSYCGGSARSGKSQGQ